MTYTLRTWIDGEEITPVTYRVGAIALSKFRDTVDALSRRRESCYVTVNAEPGPFPERSWTVASYQQARTQ